MRQLTCILTTVMTTFTAFAQDQDFHNTSMSESRNPEVLHLTEKLLPTYGCWKEGRVSFNEDDINVVVVYPLDIDMYEYVIIIMWDQLIFDRTQILEGKVL